MAQGIECLVHSMRTYILGMLIMEACLSKRALCLGRGGDKRAPGDYWVASLSHTAGSRFSERPYLRK